MVVFVCVVVVLLLRLFYEFFNVFMVWVFVVGGKGIVMFVVCFLVDGCYVVLLCFI